MEDFLVDAPCLYYSCKEDGTLVNVNKQLCKLLGYQLDELIGKKADLFCTVATRIFQQTHLYPLLKMQGHAEEIYITLQKKNSEVLPVLLNAALTGKEGARLMSFVGIVVHNRKKFEVELVAARKAAETALHENTALLQAKEALQLHAEQLDQQMQTVRRQNEEMKQFNRVVTHDLQEPLRKLFVFTSMLLETENSNASGKAAKRISAIAENLRSIVSGLQQYVWLTDTPIRHVQVSLDHILGLARMRIVQEYPDVQLELTSEKLPAVEADAEQMQFLFHEILTNAVRFRKPGNKVSVSVSASELRLNQFRSMPGKYKYARHIRLEIRDDGLGMRNEYKDQALELFRRLHPVSGRGIGLSLCKKIVENHGGLLSLESEEGRGTVVIILLPAPEEPGREPDQNMKTKKTLSGDV